MPRDNVVPWSPSEEQNLLPWLSRNRKLSWKAKAKAYSRQHLINRSGESLRGKQNHLRRKRRLARRISHSSNLFRRRRPHAQRRRVPVQLPMSLPVLTMNAPNREVGQLLESFRLRFSGPSSQATVSSAEDQQLGEILLYSKLEWEMPGYSTYS